MGYHVAIAANYGMGGALLRSRIKVYPAGRSRGGDSLVWAAAADFKPDVIISLYDAWALEFPSDPRIEHIPWVAWVTVDSAPLDPRSKKILTKATGIVAYSKFGFDVLSKAELQDVTYIPLGIDTAVFQPGSRAAAREGMAHPITGELIGSRPLFGMVGRNNTSPSRKGFDVALLAFRRLLMDTGVDAYLYVHSCANRADGGLDLIAMAGELGIQDRVMFCNQVQNNLGFSEAQMRTIYQSLDVLLEPSRAEGFGLPILEAAACGVPSIATRHSAMVELTESSGGWLVNADPMRMVTETWWANPSVAALHSVMFDAATDGDVAKLKRASAARSFAEGYDFSAKVAPAWDAYLKGLLC